MWWEYKEHPADTAEKVEGWLTNFANELKALINPEQSV